MSDPFAVIAAERRALADLVESLDAEQLAVRSLCGAWSVQDVAAHLLVGPTASLREFGVAMLRARGRFEVANDLMVRNRRHLGPAELAALLREHAGSRFTPPTFDWHAPLSDLRIHRLDMTVPLGLEPGMTPEPWPDVLDFLLTPKARGAFVPGGRPPLALHATDVAWQGGDADAPAVHGTASALAAALTGRTALLAQLDGPGVDPIRAWLNA